MPKQRRLGRGIDALLQGRDISQLENASASVMTVPLERIHPNPDQPRKTFDENSLQELARSIEERGIIQPILAEEQDNGDYLIIAGERRWRAAKLAGLTVAPVLPGVFSDEEKREIALIENIQRQDLSPLEEAKAYQDLLETVGLSQEELARRLGKSRPAIANSLRLLKLPLSIQDRVNERKLTAGHARTLLGLTGSAAAVIEELATRVIEDDISVRYLEQLVTLLNRGMELKEAWSHLFDRASDAVDVTNASGDREDPHQSVSGRSEERNAADNSGPSGGSSSGPPGVPRKSPEMEHIEQRMIETLGTRVVVQGTDNRGRIEISYHSMEDLERIAEIIIGEETFSS